MAKVHSGAMGEFMSKDEIVWVPQGTNEKIEALARKLGLRKGRSAQPWLDVCWSLSGNSTFHKLKTRIVDADYLQSMGI